MVNLNAATLLSAKSQSILRTTGMKQQNYSRQINFDL